MLMKLKFIFKPKRSGILLYRCSLCDCTFKIQKEDIDMAIVESIAYASKIAHDCDELSIGVAELQGAAVNHPQEIS